MTGLLATATVLVTVVEGPPWRRSERDIEVFPVATIEFEGTWVVLYDHDGTVIYATCRAVSIDRQRIES